MTETRPVERILVVGAGPAGLAAVRSYREHGGTAAVTLIGKESRLPYRRPPLTKEFLRGEMGPEELPIESADWFRDNEIALRLGEQVSDVDARTGSVTIGGERVCAEAIVLATGSEPIRPKIPGLDDLRVRTVREQGDSEEIAHQVLDGTRVAVIGTGFIGCELAASLVMRGASVELIGREPAPQQQRLGEDAAAQIAEWLSRMGVNLRMNAKVSAVHDAQQVQIENDGTVDADLVVVGMGARPRIELADAAGLPIEEGGIRTDEHMRVSGSVFAVGDVARAFNTSAGRRLRVEHWGDALGQGEVVGRVLAGERASWDAVPGFWSTIGHNTLKYAAWGDGYDYDRFESHPDGGFTIWYYRDDTPVGVLTHGRDDDYEAGQDLIRNHGEHKG